MDLLSTGVKLCFPEQKTSTKNEKFMVQKSQCLVVPKDLGTKQKWTVKRCANSGPPPSLDSEQRDITIITKIGMKKVGSRGRSEYSPRNQSLSFTKAAF